MKYNIFADFIGQHEFEIEAETKAEAEEKAMGELDKLIFDRTAHLDEMNLQNLVVSEANPKFKTYRTYYFPDINAAFYIKARDIREADKLAREKIKEINRYLNKEENVIIDLDGPFDYSIEEVAEYMIKI